MRGASFESDSPPASGEAAMHCVHPRPPRREGEAGTGALSSPASSAAPAAAAADASRRPPCRRARGARPAARRSAPTEAASSPSVGSSSSQSGAGDSASRASASRRFCPADSMRAGRSASSARPSAASAVRHRRRPERAAEAQVLGHREPRLHRVLMAEIGDARAHAPAGRPARPRRPTAAGRRPAAPGRRAGAAASICRSRSGRPAAARRPPARANARSRNTSRSPRNAASPSACSTPLPRRRPMDAPPAGVVKAAAADKRLPRAARTMPLRGTTRGACEPGQTRHDSDRAGQPEDPPHPDRGRQELRLFLAARGGEDAGRHLPPAGQPEGAAGERAALRGRHAATRSTTPRRSPAGWTPRTPTRRCRSGRRAS